MAKNHANSVKDDETYEELRDKGMSKEKAARIANAKQNESQKPSKKGGQSNAYENWTRDELYAKAKQVGIEGRSNMNKGELKKALRQH
ncbi:DUF7218 family protein [Minwuia thermotolerans]|uniref:Rho termination factor n=1 Tax=Minwuia thermotolerans TaxID=2056226 RepID=A0A2M9FWY3_9PROT|nr:Rho termination factor [Minwuia thermotolerans]PJK27972.1 Rho termination factor [Minwuia thermotolerans]